MAKDKFPYKAWHVPLVCAIKEVSVIGTRWSPAYLTLETGKAVHRDTIFPSKAEAIAGARRMLSAQAVRMARSEELHNKRRATLARVEAGNG